MITTRPEEEEEILSKFVADMPTKLSWQSPTSIFGLWVFWSQEEEEEASHLTSSSTSPVLAIRNRIKTALCSFNVDFRLSADVLVQFWAPTMIGGLHQLTTSHQPFALHSMNEHLARYRKHCFSYKFAVGEGIPGRIFRNQVNEYSPDLSYYSINEYPQRDIALSCGITKILALPIFQPFGTDQSCVGVIELLSSSRIPMFSFNIALEIAGLNIIHTQNILTKQIPKQIQEGVDHVTKKIRNALQQACETCGLPLARAWFRCPNSTSKGHCGNLISGMRELVVSVPGMMATYNTHMSFSSCEYRVASSFQHVRVGQGLLGNAFLSHKPYLCRDVTQLGMSEYPLAHTARKSGFTTCFAIALQSIATGNRDYVLVFFLPVDTTYSRSDFHGLLSSVLTIIKSHLKTFEAVTGDPGDELFTEVISSLLIPSLNHSKHAELLLPTFQNEGEVLQVQLVMEEFVRNGSDSVGLEQSQTACLSKEKCLVKKSKAHYQKKESSCSYETLKQHFGRKLDDAAESLGVSRSTVKRWCRDNNIGRWPFPKRSKVSSSQPIPKQINASIQENAVPISESSGRDPSSSDLRTNFAPKQATSTMTVKATYRNDILKFQLCFSSTMTDLVEKVILRLKLSEGTFNIKYQDDDGDNILIACDEDLQDCMNSLKLLKETTIKMLIEPITNVAP